MRKIEKSIKKNKKEVRGLLPPFKGLDNVKDDARCNTFSSIDRTFTPNFSFTSLCFKAIICKAK